MSDHREPQLKKTDIDRRELFKVGAVGLGAAVLGVTATGRPGAAATIPAPTLGQAPAQPFAAPPMDTVRIGFVGVGGMGSAHCRNLLRIEGVELKAVCDIVPEKVTRIQDWTVEAGQPRPTGYDRGEWDFVRMCEAEELDLVYNATPWEWHVPICVAAMENGKHAATEVPAAYTIEDCWRLVENAEKYQKHCLMMENVNYGRWESMVLNMVHQGVFGEILHGEGGYLHDLRDIKFSSEGEGLWRRNHAWTRNGNLYPTHGLGPIMQCMNINRGDRFEYVVSMSGPSRGLQAYAKEHFPEGAPQRYEQFALGDVNVSLIHTANGRTIYVNHDTNLPRPYSRIHLVQGTKGLFSGYPNQLYIEGRSPQHRWEEAQEYYEEFQHPLWKAMEERAQGAGHGGMDFIEDYRLIECLRQGVPTDVNVYDAAALSAVCGLSEWSVAHKSAPIEFPDFTRGRWKTNPPLGIVEG